jgi:type II secretory pathway predicted ATPase ExeA
MAADLESLMYAIFYGFESCGFKLMPDPSFRFAHSSYTAAFQTLREAMTKSAGLAVLTGVPGVGKTTLVDDLATRFESDGAIVRKLTNSLTDADDLPRSFAFAFGIQASALGRAQLLTELKENLISTNPGRLPVILLIDEAQFLSVEALQELYLLFDLIAGQGYVVQILLAGQQPLWNTLSQPGCEQVRQLICVGCRLLPLSPEETRNYVAQALGGIGWRGDPEINADALRLIYERTGGVPRFINLVMGRLLLHGSLGEAHSLGSHDVEAVLKQLGEDHPELVLDRSKQQPSAEPPSFESLLPLNLQAVDKAEARGLRIQQRHVSRVNGQERESAAGPSVHLPQRMNVWDWKRVVVGLWAVCISASTIFALSFRTDPLAPSAAREPERLEHPVFAGTADVDKAVGEGAETKLEPHEQVVVLKPDKEAVAPPDRIEETEGRELEMVLSTSGIAEFELTSNAHQVLLAEMLPAGTSPETNKTKPPKTAETKGQAAREVGELLAKAEFALSRNRLTVPSGDNAYSHYRAVLARDPSNAKARTGVQLIVRKYRQLAKQQLNKRDMRQARLFALRGLRISPRDRQLLKIKRQASAGRVAQRENELPAGLDRVIKWLRSGDSTYSAFLDH